MSKTRFAFLLALVIGSAGLSIYIAFLAMQEEALDGSIFRAILPLLLLASIALRSLFKHQEP